MVSASHAPINDKTKSAKSNQEGFYEKIQTRSIRSSYDRCRACRFFHRSKLRSAVRRRDSVFHDCRHRLHCLHNRQSRRIEMLCNLLPFHCFSCSFFQSKSRVFIPWLFLFFFFRQLFSQ